MRQRATPEEVLKVLGGSYTVRRYPYPHQPELRAWDTADLYLLDELAPHLSEVNRICVLHDAFGALTLPLMSSNVREVIYYGDSWLSRHALELNLELNLELQDDQQDSPTLIFENHLEGLLELPPPDCIIGRVPKLTHQLIALLRVLNRWVEAGTMLILGGMDKHLSRGQYEQLERFYGPAQYLPGVKKARLWRAHCDPSSEVSQPVEFTSILMSDQEISVPEFSLILTSGPNVFSQGKIDLGSRFLLAHLSKIPSRRRVADLGCGYGLLGLAYLRQHPEAEMILCDESFQAVEATRLNVQRHFPDAQTHIYADDGLKSVAPGSLDLVICNPPFHQGHTISTDLARSLFDDAHRALTVGGELWVIANRHLGYHINLKRIFGNCLTRVSNRKFVIIQSTK